MEKASFFDFTAQVVRRLQVQQGFAGWSANVRMPDALLGLVRDYEERIKVSEKMVYLITRSLLLHRLNFR